MLEEPLREQLMSPVGVLLPENLWPPTPRKAKVWVGTEQEYSDMCRGCAEVGLFTFLREVMHAHGHQVLDGLMGVQKKDSVLPSGLPIWHMIINAIQANAYQELLGGDMAMLPYFAQWNGIQLDQEDLVVSWSEADVSAAFLIFRMEPSWFGMQPSQSQEASLRNGVQSLLPNLSCSRQLLP